MRFVSLVSVVTTVLLVSQLQFSYADEARGLQPRQGGIRGRKNDANTQRIARVLRKQHRVEEAMKGAWSEGEEESDEGYDYYGKKKHKKGKKSSKKSRKGKKSRSSSTSSSGSSKSGGSDNGSSDSGSGGGSGSDSGGGSGHKPTHPPTPEPHKPEPLVTIKGETFQPFAIVTVPTTPALNLTNSLDDSPTPIIGTVYLYDNYTRTVTNVNMYEFNITIDDNLLEVWARVAGFCTRTSDSTMGDGANGYCHFTYEIEDPSTMFTIGSFVAEGTILPSDQVSRLTVTGGSDSFFGVCGTIMVKPSVLNFGFNPPMIEPTTVDPFDEVDGYIHILDLELPLSSLS